MKRAAFTFSWETSRDHFYHDIPEDQAKLAWSRLRPQDATIYLEPCPLTTWPDVPSSYILMTDDRAMKSAWWRQTAEDRLHGDVIELPGGHSPFLSFPTLLAEALIAAGARR